MRIVAEVDCSESGEEGFVRSGDLWAGDGEDHDESQWIVTV